MSDVNKNTNDVSNLTDTEEKDLLGKLETLEVEEPLKDIEIGEVTLDENKEEPQKELVFLYDDDEKNPNYRKKSDETPKKKNGNLKKKAGIILASAAGIILAVYLGFALYFNSHFYFFTKVNGNDFAAKSVKDVEAFMEKQVNGFELTLQRNDNISETITGKDISLRYHPGKELEEAIKKQNPLLWPKAFFQAEHLEIPVGVEYDENALTTLISQLDCVVNKNPVEPVSATPVFDGNEFVIQKEVPGNKVNVESLTEAIKEQLNGFTDTLNMAEKGCYYQPKYYSDSAEVLEAQKKMNAYLTAKVTYDFAPHTEVVDQTVISKWLSVDENMQVVFQKQKVAEYIKELANKYNTSGKPRTFVTATGNTVQVKNGIYGWKINQEKEYNKLIANIEAGETVKREPEYSRRAASHEGNDFGNTYAEVDLTAQKMWFIKNGQIVLESPVVTGKPSTGNATPQGTYTVTYTQKGAVLRGKLRPDGTREYESPVDYWMPFNGGIGFHDASWQSSFGGSRYLTHGSHGCINMPLEKARALFGYLKAGTPVICHY